MDFSATYCQTRRNIEEHGWSLTSRLAGLTSRLLRLAGQRDHQAFLNLKQECQETKVAISDSHRDLRQHRHVHGC